MAGHVDWQHRVMSKLRGRIRELSSRSGLTRWMVLNYHWFHPEVVECGRPDWDAIAVLMGTEGVRMGGRGRGDVPTGDAVRKAYMREGRRRAKGLPSPAIPVAASITPGAIVPIHDAPDPDRSEILIQNQIRQMRGRGIK